MASGIINEFNLNKSSLIEASAGTGKTFTITYLVLRLLLGSGNDKAFEQGPLSIEDILIVTFTNAATSDLKRRVRESIHRARIVFEFLYKYKKENNKDFDYGNSSEIDENLKEIIKEMHEKEKNASKSAITKANSQDINLLCARTLLRAERNIDNCSISTIHSFCNNIISKVFAFESGEAFQTKLVTNTIYGFNEGILKTIRKFCYVNENEKNEEWINTAKEILALMDTNFSSDTILNVCRNLLKVTSLDTKGSSNFKGFNVEGLTYLDPTKSLKQNIQNLFDEYKKGERTLVQSLHTFLQGSIFPKLLDKNKYETVQDVLKDLLQEDNFSNFFYENCKVNWNTTEEKVREKLRNYFNVLIDLLSNKNTDLKDIKTPSFKKADKSDGIFIVCNKKEVFTKDIDSIFNSINDLRKTFINKLLFLFAIQSLDYANEIKQQDKVMSFDDVLKRASQVVQSKTNDLKTILRKRYPVLMVDEFQDTDPFQYEIFKNVYLEEDSNNKSNKAVCYFIGDPKQSIYSFRGSDINSYLKAKKEINENWNKNKNKDQNDEQKSGVYSLDTNYRSTEALINSVNAIFMQEKEGDCNAEVFGNNKGIEFKPVNSNERKKTLCYQGKELTDIGCFIHLLKDDEIEAQNVAAIFIYNLLRYKNEVGLQGDTNKLSEGQYSYLKEGTTDTATIIPITEKDITILVRNKREFSEIEKALSHFNIPCVYYSSRESVSETAEATYIKNLMEAMAYPTNLQLVKKMLACGILPLDANDFFDSVEDQNLEKEVELLKSSLILWKQKGFFTAFSFWFRNELHQGLSRSLEQSNGERSVTNLYHLAEIVQSYHANKETIYAQLDHFNEFLSESQEETEDANLPETTLKRLSSEKQQIAVYTIHASKGLEFPIVIMPFLENWPKETNRDVFTSRYYKKTEGSKNNQSGKYYINLEGTTKEEEVSISEARKEENTRLDYVALTRASILNYLIFSDRSSKEPNQTLAKLKAKLSPENKEGKIEGYENFYVEDLRQKDVDSILNNNESIVKNSIGTATFDDETYKVKEFDKSCIKNNFIVSSYSAITSGVQKLPNLSQKENDEDNSKEVLEDKVVDDSTLNQFNFPKGASAGTFLHAILEETDFSKLKYLDTQAKGTDAYLYLQNICAEFCKLDPNKVIKKWCRSIILDNTYGENLEEDAPAALFSFMYNILKAPIVSFEDGSKLSLNAIAKDDFVPEMRFWMPCDNFNLQSFNAICKQSALKLLEDKELINSLSLPRDEDLSGFLTGSLDLSFRFKVNGCYKYFVLDYKSNYLGNNAQDYSSDKIIKSVLDHRYDVQYLIYTVVLHRTLKKRLKDYDYDRDVGGVIYLYLRGLNANCKDDVSSGVFYTKVDKNIIEKLDALLEDRD